MGFARKKQILNNVSIPSPFIATGARNLSKGHLGGFIFGCKNSTIQECFIKQLFGLPAQHFLYVKNIDPGLPLFLFNYSDRNLHGIFEAASVGQLNIDPYGWTTDGSERTLYPAQVQVRVRLYCQPLPENQFASVIHENYYTQSHFWFELDHAQANKLIALFSSQVVAPAASFLQNMSKWQIKTQCLPSSQRKEEDGNSGAISSPSLGNDRHPSHENNLKIAEKSEIDMILAKLKKLAVNCDLSNSFHMNHVEENFTPGMHLEDDSAHIEEIIRGENKEDCPLSFTDFPSSVAQLMQEIEKLRVFRKDQIQKMGQLEQKLVESEIEIQLLKDHCIRLESMSNHSEPLCDSTMIGSLDEGHCDPHDIIFLVGGYDGQSLLSSLDLYSPSRDVITSRRLMSVVRSYTSVTNLNGNLYVIGGGNGSVWYDTVESYNLPNDEWNSHPSLKEKKGSLAAATLNNKIFAMGGGNEVECFSDVEMFDLDVGGWISSRSMLQKRFAFAAVELNKVLYVAGGFDGKDYLQSAERFDSREHSWSKIASMNSRRGCHSLVVLDEKLYALGGFDGSKMVPSVEVFDPQCGMWMIEDPMNHPRGYLSAAVLGDSIYVIGGVNDNKNILNTVERYEKGKGWQVTKLGGVGKRCFSSAVVL